MTFINNSFLFIYFVVPSGKYFFPLSLYNLITAFSNMSYTDKDLGIISETKSSFTLKKYLRNFDCYLKHIMYYLIIHNITVKHRLYVSFIPCAMPIFLKKRYPIPFYIRRPSCMFYQFLKTFLSLYRRPYIYSKYKVFALY